MHIRFVSALRTCAHRAHPSGGHFRCETPRKGTNGAWLKTRSRSDAIRVNGLGLHTSVLVWLKVPNASSTGNTPKHIAKPNLPLAEALRS